VALRIYTNESVHAAIATGLQQRGVDALSARDSANLGMSDEEQLQYAIREQAVIFTHDDDFLRIAHAWLQQGREHWGVIYVHEQKLSVGECIRRLAD
jgi:predicted nuclease of predicted toxin-antitoxin system